MFCNDARNTVRCASNRMSLGSCYAAEHQSPLPLYWQYFTNSSVAGRSSYRDYCPVVVPFKEGSCAQSAAEAIASMNDYNVFSDAARCIDGAFRPKVASRVIRLYSGMCANVKCDTERRKYSVQVRGSSRYVYCTPSLRLQLSSVSKAFVWGSYITCPPYVEVCQGNVQAVKDHGDSVRDGRGLPV
ncbi:major surface protease gp63, putative [Leishmania tarentolae]|nr:major surface protease gp63, putative [Leishmania tarentolae]